MTYTIYPKKFFFILKLTKLVRKVKICVRRLVVYQLTWWNAIDLVRDRHLESIQFYDVK